ncbi:hypothetical protein ARALYDRAFT_905588 [Arabidopsis lyrata subsp. lyrata]|uniref:50S ribosomal protein L33, chloroplastic n=1 Tax=Arabidopsis lyrata subsp. lyrata TaxID=81972 RepID=D7LML3_ARALL|nr:hypothetical protein ARALYDRAFT_905588 [Arabidopsis lyrata subsp. lyrata]
MAKVKMLRVTIILECTSSFRNYIKKASAGMYNTPSRLELKKFCPYCCKHTIHGEIKKYIKLSACISIFILRRRIMLVSIYMYVYINQ